MESHAFCDCFAEREALMQGRFLSCMWRPGCYTAKAAKIAAKVLRMRGGPVSASGRKVAGRG